MTFKIWLAVLVLLGSFGLVSCDYGDSIPGDLYTQDLYPAEDSSYNVGSSTLAFTNGYFDNVYIDGILLPTIKSGSVTTGVAGTATVTFNTAFPDADYSISLCPVSGADTVSVMWNTKAAGSFGVKAEDNEGNNEDNTEILWIAVTYSNP